MSLNREATNHAESQMRWWQGLDRYCWIVLTVAALGWLFDTMDQNLFNLVRAPSLREMLRPVVSDARLLDAEQKEKLEPALRAQLESAAKSALDAEVKKKGGTVTAIFLLGWAVGGFVFGVLGDRLGRTKTMIITILIYAVFTGGSGLVHTWQWYSVMRFMTALGVGGEWAAGAALIAEVFPSRSRAMALGLLQALSAVGNMMAAGITLTMGNLDTRWRWAFFIGAMPAFLIIWIMKSVKEPEQWHQAKAQEKLGQELGNMFHLFTDPVLRRNTIAAVLMATAGVVGVWGVAFFSTDMIRGELTAIVKDPTHRDRMMSMVFMLQQVGAFFGIYLFAMFSVRFNRRSAFTLWFALAWVAVLAFVWGISGSGHAAFGRALVLAPIMGFCTLGPFSGYTVYFPELFPTRLRSSGCGFCYNAARILAAAAPFTLGKLAAKMATHAPDGSIISSGYAPAATVVCFIYILGFVGAYLGPETKGKPLPE